MQWLKLQDKEYRNYFYGKIIKNYSRCQYRKVEAQPVALQSSIEWKTTILMQPHNSSKTENHIKIKKFDPNFMQLATLFPR